MNKDARTIISSHPSALEEVLVEMKELHAETVALLKQHQTQIQQLSKEIAELRQLIQ